MKAQLIFFLLIVFSTPSQAGLVIEAGPSWVTTSKRSTDSENTANYYGYSGKLAIGYSLFSTLDMGIDGIYSDQTAGNETYGKLKMSRYGLWGNIDFFDSFYLRYSSGINQQTIENDQNLNDLNGTWNGQYNSLGIGGIITISKNSQSLVGINLTQSDLKNSNSDSQHTFDSFSVEVKFKIKSRSKSSGPSNSLIRSFVKSLNFFD